MEMENMENLENFTYDGNYTNFEPLFDLKDNVSKYLVMIPPSSSMLLKGGQANFSFSVRYILKYFTLLSSQ